MKFDLVRRPGLLGSVRRPIVHGDPGQVRTVTKSRHLGDRFA
jgi:hypothetical protein